MSSNVNGRVRTMKPGFGFVDGDDGVSYYYHAAELKGQAITVGAHVSFTPKSNPKGPVAVGIKLLEAPAAKGKGKGKGEKGAGAKAPAKPAAPAEAKPAAKSATAPSPPAPTPAAASTVPAADTTVAAKVQKASETTPTPAAPSTTTAVAAAAPALVKVKEEAVAVDSAATAATTTTVTASVPTAGVTAVADPAVTTDSVTVSAAETVVADASPAVATLPATTPAQVSVIDRAVVEAPTATTTTTTTTTTYLATVTGSEHSTAASAPVSLVERTVVAANPATAAATIAAAAERVESSAPVVVRRVPLESSPPAPSTAAQERVVAVATTITTTTSPRASASPSQYSAATSTPVVRRYPLEPAGTPSPAAERVVVHTSSPQYTTVAATSPVVERVLARTSVLSSAQASPTVASLGVQRNTVEAKPVEPALVLDRETRLVGAQEGYMSAGMRVLPARVVPTGTLASLGLSTGTPLIVRAAQTVTPTLTVQSPARAQVSGTEVRRVVATSEPPSPLPLQTSLNYLASRDRPASSSRLTASPVMRLGDPNYKPWYSAGRATSEVVSVTDGSPRVAYAERFRYRYISVNEPYSNTSPTMITPSPTRVNLEDRFRQYKAPTRYVQKLHTEVFYDPPHVSCSHDVVPLSIHNETGLRFSSL
eukprot:EG_transcript_5747